MFILAHHATSGVPTIYRLWRGARLSRREASGAWVLRTLLWRAALQDYATISASRTRSASPLRCGCGDEVHATHVARAERCTTRIDVATDHVREVSQCTAGVVASVSHSARQEEKKARRATPLHVFLSYRLTCFFLLLINSHGHTCSNCSHSSYIIDVRYILYTKVIIDTYICMRRWTKGNMYCRSVCV